MFDVNEIRKDFPLLSNHPEIVYFDNGATTLKPQCVIDAVTHFYTEIGASVHRGDYALSLESDRRYDHSREVVASFLNADPQEVVFTHNTTGSLNQVAYDLCQHYLKPGDIILTTEGEHASNLLPWYRLQKEYGIQVVYMPVDACGVIQVDEVSSLMNSKVKLIAVAHVTNVLGSVQPIDKLAEIAHAHGARILVDGAQSVPHRPIDVKKYDIDYLAFSAHKMCGPSGVGVLYAKQEYMNTMDPVFLGGGMNARFSKDGEMILKKNVERLEPGTPNIEGVQAFGVACEYLMHIGMDAIEAYEKELRAYFLSQVEDLDHLIIYNKDNVSGPITFNVKDVFAQDSATYLASKNICVRSGNHCAKILHNLIGTDQTVRASLYFYNTKEEVDRCVQAMKEISVENAIGVFF